MKISRKFFLLSFSIILIFFLLTPSVFAQGRPDNTGKAKPAVSQTKKAEAAIRLEGKKLEACQKREQSIKQRIDRLNSFVENMLEKFDAIAERVKEYYLTKVEPGGKTLANYDALVAQVDESKTAVNDALAQAKLNAEEFDCEGDDPKGMMEQFKTDMLAVKQALKEYRTAIKDLIVGIRSLTGKTQSGTAGTPGVSKPEDSEEEDEEENGTPEPTELETPVPSGTETPDNGD